MLATVAIIHGKQLPDGAGEDSFDVSLALFGRKRDGAARGPLVMANAEGVMAIRQGPWKLIAKGAAPGALPKSPWTREGDKAQLYNLAEDLRETTDVIARHPEIAERLVRLLDQYREQGYSRPKN